MLPLQSSAVGSATAASSPSTSPAAFSELPFQAAIKQEPDSAQPYAVHARPLSAPGYKAASPMSIADQRPLSSHSNKDDGEQRRLSKRVTFSDLPFPPAYLSPQSNAFSPVADHAKSDGTRAQRRERKLPTKPILKSACMAALETNYLKSTDPSIATGTANITPDIKMNSRPVDSLSFALSAYPSFTAMLQTMCEALASNDLTNKLNIYLTLNCIVRTYRSYPDADILLEKVHNLVSSIKRDVEAPTLNLSNKHDSVMASDPRVYVCSSFQLITVLSSH
ncbi:uncharacterized protein V1510DRAFT_409566 [Dipodascopsis tothii]|uniref:uncharacterized protein n=1 Tax=Dipodascopsis tothii TaxID=44089 RepID=UPI0034CE89BF